jgi:hypothetical protein
MNRLLPSLAAVVLCFAASAGQASTVYFDSGSAKVNTAKAARHKQKVWVPAHRSKGRLVRGHYVRR